MQRLALFSRKDSFWLPHYLTKYRHCPRPEHLTISIYPHSLGEHLMYLQFANVIGDCGVEEGGGGKRGGRDGICK